MHILFINQHYYPDFAATGQLLAELCDDLVQTGFRVTVIAGYPEPGTYPPNEKPRPTEENGSLKIYRIYNHPVGKKTLTNRLLHFFSFWVGSIIKSMVVSRPDLVFVMSTPPLLNGITANILRILRRVPYVYNVQDLYPDIAIEMGTIRNPMIIRLSAAIEQYINRHAMAVATLSETMKNRISSHGVSTDQIVVIPNWSDENLLKPQSASALRTRWGLDSCHVLMYSGNIGLSQGLEMLIDWLKPIASEFASFRFLIVGNGARLPAILEKIAIENIRFVIHQPFQPKSMLGDSLNAADLHLVPLTAGMANYLVPSKFYGIVAVGKPLLAIVDEGSEIDRMVSEHNLGFSVRPGDEQRVQAVLRTWLQNPESIRRLAPGIRSYFEQNLTRKQATGSYIRFLNSLSVPS